MGHKLYNIVGHFAEDKLNDFRIFRSHLLLQITAAVGVRMNDF